MDPRGLYTARYRRGSTGVVISFIAASSQEMAEEVLREWCAQNNVRFIRVEPAILADESIFSDERLEELKAEFDERKRRADRAIKKQAEADRKMSAPAAPPSVKDPRGKAEAAAAAR